MTTQEVLALLKKHLINDADAGGTWDVLTALRGPDNEDGLTKHATTEVIRYKLLGDGVGTVEDGQCSFRGFFLSHDSEQSARVRNKLGYDHFHRHAQKAFQILGLKWYGVNE